MTYPAFLYARSYERVRPIPAVTSCFLVSIRPLLRAGTQRHPHGFNHLQVSIRPLLRAGTSRYEHLFDNGASFYTPALTSGYLQVAFHVTPDLVSIRPLLRAGTQQGRNCRSGWGFYTPALTSGYPPFGLIIRIHLGFYTPALTSGYRSGADAERVLLGFYTPALASGYVKDNYQRALVVVSIHPLLRAGTQAFLHISVVVMFLYTRSYERVPQWASSLPSYLSFYTPALASGYSKYY